MKYGDVNITMGFVEKFIEMFRLRNKLSIKTALYTNQLFKRLFKPIMQERTDEQMKYGYENMSMGFVESLLKCSD